MSFFELGYQTSVNPNKKVSTDSAKIDRPGYNICMYWTNFRQPTAHVQQDIFGKTLTEVCSLDL